MIESMLESMIESKLESVIEGMIESVIESMIESMIESISGSLRSISTEFHAHTYNCAIAGEFQGSVSDAVSYIYT